MNYILLEQYTPFATFFIIWTGIATFTWSATTTSKIFNKELVAKRLLSSDKPFDQVKNQLTRWVEQVLARKYAGRFWVFWHLALVILTGWYALRALQQVDSCGKVAIDKKTVIHSKNFSSLQMLHYNRYVLVWLNLQSIQQWYPAGMLQHPRVPFTILKELKTFFNISLGTHFQNVSKP